MRILIIRTSAMGDVVHALPVLTALRRHLPQARIGWVVEEAMAPVLEGHPDLDERITVRLRHWGKQPFTRRTVRELGAFLGAIHRFSPDITLDLMGNHKAGVISALTMSDRRIGAVRQARREPSSSVWISESVEPRGIHAVDRMLSLLDGLGLPPEPADFGPDKIFRGEIPAAAREIFERHSEPFVAIHPGAGWANKVYPPERWGEVARRLREATGLSTLVAMAHGEEKLAAGVEATSGGAARAVAAPDLPTLAALLRRARLVLGGDSGPTHMAHALGTSILMVMGPTDPMRNGPYGEPERAVWRLLPCSFCHRRFGETKACLLEIPADRVAEQALEILETVPRDRGQPQGLPLQPGPDSEPAGRSM